MQGRQNREKGERTVVEKRGKCVKWNFRNRRKGERFFAYVCMNCCFSRDKGRAGRSFLVCARNVDIYDTERVGSEMMDHRWGGFSDDMYTPHDW